MDAATGRALNLHTPLGKDVLLVASLRGSEAVSELFAVHLELLAEPSADIPFERLLGQAATVTLQTDGAPPRYFNGIINRLEEGDAVDDFVRFEADLVPAFWLSTQQIQSRIFQRLTVPEILRQVLQGLDVAFELGRTYHPREYCVQYHESDFAFASRLMEMEGIAYYFRHARDRHTLVIADTLPGSDQRGSVVYQLDRGTRGPCIWSWRKAQHITPSKWSLRDYNFELPDQHLEASAQVAEVAQAGTARHRLRGGFNDTVEVFAGVGGYGWFADDVAPDGHAQPGDLPRLFEEAQGQARLHAEEAAARALEVRGQGNYTWFVPGAGFDLTHHRSADAPYFLTRVEHEAQQAGFRSGQPAAIDYQNRFHCLPASIRFRPPRSTRRPVLAGTQTAVVVGPSDRDVFVDRHGRVKVQFHWNRQAQGSGSSSCWLRVAQIWAGKGWGAFFWPRIGHEVVVAFEEGNPDRPLIVGSVYNASNVPPFDMPAGDLVAGIKSCSAGADANAQANFNGILFYDRAGDEHVEIHSEHHERARTESDKQQRVGRCLTNVVGALGPAGSGSGSGGSTPLTPLESGGWGWIEPQLGRSINFVLGMAADVDIGSYGQYVVGQNVLISTNPLAFQLWAAEAEGTAFFQGFGTGATGNVEIITGGTMEGRYGPQIEAHRGPCLTTVTEASLTVRGLVGLLDGLTISTNIMAAMAPDKLEVLCVAAKLMEVVILGTLSGIEATMAWLEQAEVGNRLNKVYLECLRDSLTKENEAKGPLANGTRVAIDDMVKYTAEALEGFSTELLVQNCTHYTLAAREHAVFTSDKLLTMIADRAILANKQLGIYGQGLEASFKTEAFLDSPETIIRGRGLGGYSELKLEPTSLQCNLEGAGGRMELTKSSLKLNVVRAAAPGRPAPPGGPTLTMTADSIILKAGTSTLELGPRGIKLDALNIASNATVKHTFKAGMQKTDIEGILKEVAALKQDQ